MIRYWSDNKDMFNIIAAVSQLRQRFYNWLLNLVYGCFYNKKTYFWLIEKVPFKKYNWKIDKESEYEDTNYVVKN